MDENSLPNRPHRPGAQMFREAEDINALAKKLNLAALVLLVVLAAVYISRVGMSELRYASLPAMLGTIASLLVLFPHEYLHAVCFREDCYIYTALSRGMLFVFGAEDMTKRRFVFMSLLPNLVFGFIPFAIGMLFPEQVFFGVLGLFSITAGVGDYYNIYNAVTQVPKGGLIYMYGFHSFWYMPEK